MPIDWGPSPEMEWKISIIVLYFILGHSQQRGHCQSGSNISSLYPLWGGSCDKSSMIFFSWLSLFNICVSYHSCLTSNYWVLCGNFFGGWCLHVLHLWPSCTLYEILVSFAAFGLVEIEYYKGFNVFGKIVIYYPNTELDFYCMRY